MNSNERAALVDSLHAALETAYGARWNVDSMGVVRLIMPIIEREAATRTVPTVDDDAVERAARAMERCVDYFTYPDDGGLAICSDNHEECGEFLMDMARAALAAAGTAPEPGLDELLDSVRPDADVSVHEFMGKWRGVVTVRDYSEQQGSIQHIATGATRMEAIKAAVAQATVTAQEGASE